MGAFQRGHTTLFDSIVLQGDDLRNLDGSAGGGCGAGEEMHTQRCGRLKACLEESGRARYWGDCQFAGTHAVAQEVSEDVSFDGREHPIGRSAIHLRSMWSWRALTSPDSEFSGNGLSLACC